MKIPFVDLKAQYKSIKSEINTAIQKVISETAFIKGEYVDEFESRYANAYCVKHCIGVANGTDAIYIVLKMLGIGHRDEVITVANSWISTSEAISQTGAKPVFVDIEPDYFTIDPDKIEEKITPKTKAVLPVHLYGQSARMDKIKTICEKHDLFLVEDCAQAHFAEFNGTKIGLFGNAGAFSFYPGKNLGAYGDAGAIITNDDNLAIKVRMYANHGALKKHHHEFEGINSRLDGIQAAILTVKLSYIEEWNKRRLRNANLYNELLAEIPQVVCPSIRHNFSHVFHLYVIRTDNRDRLREYLSNKGIETAIHYPTILPLLPAYKYLEHIPEQFPIASQYQDSILSLPMFAELRPNQIKYIVEQIIKFVRNN